MQLLLSLFFLSKNCWKDWELNVIRIIKTFFNFKKVETKVKVKNDKLLFELEVIKHNQKSPKKIMEKLNQILIYVLSKQKTVERNWELNVIRIIIAFFNFKKVETKVKVKKREVTTWTRSHQHNQKSPKKIMENLNQILCNCFYLCSFLAKTVERTENWM